ncbi:MAG: hypothetical protein WBN22_01590 [Verrucomicrobiia bacterium]
MNGVRQGSFLVQFDRHAELGGLPIFLRNVVRLLCDFPTLSAIALFDNVDFHRPLLRSRHLILTDSANGGGIQRRGSSLAFDVERFIRIERGGWPDEDVSEAGKEGMS